MLVLINEHVLVMQSCNVRHFIRSLLRTRPFGHPQVLDEYWARTVGRKHDKYKRLGKTWAYLALQIFEEVAFQKIEYFAYHKINIKT